MRWVHLAGWAAIATVLIGGNAAEHSTAVQLAHTDDMDTAMTITHQSSIQIALFATPFFVLASAAMVAAGVGDAVPLDLVFTPLEVVAQVLTVLVVTVLGMNGRTNRFEGVMLLALYVILDDAFSYVPSPPGVVASP